METRGSGDMRFVMPWLFIIRFILPPTITQKTKDGQGSDRQVDDAHVQCFGRTFAKLLGGACTNRALCLYHPGDSTGHRQKKDDEDYRLAHILKLSIIQQARAIPQPLPSLASVGIFSAFPRPGWSCGA